MFCANEFGPCNERLLYNVRLGTQDRFGMLMYYVSLKPGLYKTFGTPFDAFWCCTGTGSEEYAKLTDSIYFHNNDALYVNLFIASKLNWKERGLRLSQTTKFPEEQTTTLTLESAPKQKTTLKIRIPYWAANGVKVKVNGQDQQVTPPRLLTWIWIATGSMVMWWRLLYLCLSILPRLPTISRCRPQCMAHWFLPLAWATTDLRPQ